MYSIAWQEEREMCMERRGHTAWKRQERYFDRIGVACRILRGHRQHTISRQRTISSGSLRNAPCSLSSELIVEVYMVCV